MVSFTGPVPPDVTIDVTETEATVTYGPPEGYSTSFTHYLYDSDGNIVMGPTTTAGFVIPYDSLSSASEYRHTVYTTAGDEISTVVTTDFFTREYQTLKAL